MSDLFKLDPNATYDQETIDLYRVRETSDHEQIRLRDHKHRRRIVFTDLKDKSKDIAHEGTWVDFFKLSAILGFGTFSFMQFCKAYYPSGFLLRASIPQSWGTYIKHRGPVCAFVFGFWYFGRYQRMKDTLVDLSDPNEPTPN